jgi:hypothetical protein
MLFFLFFFFFCLLPSSGCGVKRFAFDQYTPAGGSVLPGSGLSLPPGPPTPFDQTNCTLGYPATTSNPATQLVFNESDVLVAFSPSTTVTATPNLTINAWYMDEHAMTLGVRQVVVKTASGTTTTDYPISPLSGNPGMQVSPLVGSTMLTGDQAGVDTSTCSGAPDTCARPMWPALFITDITSNPSSQAGDWQWGGKPIPPSAIYGTWKAAVRTVDYTRGTIPQISVLPDADPPRNDWNLGTGIPVPAGIQSEGYTTLVSWQVGALGLASGHSYRLQFMVHDGDQHYTGGDVGQNCVDLQVP